MCDPVPHTARPPSNIMFLIYCMYHYHHHYICAMEHLSLFIYILDNNILLSAHTHRGILHATNPYKIYMYRTAQNPEVWYYRFIRIDYVPLFFAIVTLASTSKSSAMPIEEQDFTRIIDQPTSSTYRKHAGFQSSLRWRFFAIRTRLKAHTHILNCFTKITYS